MMPKVLLLDDDAEVLTAYGRVLGAIHCEVAMAARAQQALTLFAERKPFDVVVTDLKLPEMDGISFLREVRKRDPDLPVIVVTGHADASSACASLEHGAHRYLAKPVHPQALRAAVCTAAQVRELARLRREAMEYVDTGAPPSSERATCDARFSEAIDKLWLAFQPVVQYSERALFGYEALVRSYEPTLHYPSILFSTADRLGRLHELGRRIRYLAAAAIDSAPAGTTLFINLHPSDLNDPELYETDSPLAQVAHRIAFEITERHSLENITEAAARVQVLRDLGYRIVVDDLGAGYSGLSTFGQLQPDMVKLDVSLVRGVDLSPRRQSLLRSMIAVCRRDLGVEVICEGVETTSERDTLARLNGDLMQGHLFGLPRPDFCGVNLEAESHCACAKKFLL